MSTNGHSDSGPTGDEGPVLWVPEGYEEPRKVHNNYVQFRNCLRGLLSFRVDHGHIIDWKMENERYVQLCEDIDEIRQKIHEGKNPK